jgi:hypothetical protein
MVPRGLAVLVVLPVLSCTGVSGVVGDGTGGGSALIPSSRDTGTYTFYLEERSEVVWYEMRDVLSRLRILPASDQLTPESGRLVTRRFSLNPSTVHCGARPSGEQPLARDVVGVLTAELHPAGAVRTRVTFRLDAQSASIEPNRSGVRTACVSRGILERRIVEGTDQRLR